MTRIPRLAPGCNLKLLPLTPADAFLLSRVDGTANENELALVTGFPPEQVAMMLDRLDTLGAIELPGGSGSQTRLRTAPPQPAPVPPPPAPAELEEGVAIEPARRRRILDFHQRLGELNHYEILGIDPQASTKQVKAAFHALGAEFHPDRYFRKPIGSYLPKIEAIFSRLTRAHDVLVSPQRAAYDEELGRASGRRTGPQPVQAAAAGEDLHALRRQILARKLSGTHAATTTATPARRPEVAADAGGAQRAAEAVGAQQEQAATEARLAQIARNLEQGKSALDRRDFTAAINAYKMAASLAPDDRNVQATCNDGIQRAAAALADGYWEQAVHAEREQRWEEAALGYFKVCAGRPNDALAHERVANAAIKAGNVRRAVEFARKAIEIAPGTALFHVTLARAYAAAGLETSAHGELDRALALAPTDTRIQNLIARVRSLPRKAGNAG